MITLRARGVAAAAILATVCAASPAAASGEVNIYSYRQEVLIRPLLDRFEETTGIKVNVVFAKKGMIQRLKAEGVNSPADVVLTVDAARLIRVKEEGLLQPVRSAKLEADIPAQYRDPEGHWFGLSVRARPIMYNTAKVKPADLSTYQDLADPKWKGRICIRSSSNVYNQSLLAAMIAHMGKDKAEAWAKGLVANFARKPQGGDRDQIRAAAAGECDIAIANTYYLAGMIKGKKDSDKAAAAKMKIFWPNQGGTGAHVNVSGAGVTMSSKNKDNAIKLLEFLAGDEAQRLYADKVNEYPVRAGIPVTKVVAGFGEFKADTLRLATLAKHNAEAVRIADRAGWP
ncbi:MAG: Fe(3+) ABC transporter substrate-binding protein [Alphaproteobacteria bacterium]|nr:Fe(3+) ABC transporter substrate-binding protein [Alphaproteobacteria bacterium]